MKILRDILNALNEIVRLLKNIEYYVRTQRSG